MYILAFVLFGRGGCGEGSIWLGRVRRRSSRMDEGRADEFNVGRGKAEEFKVGWSEG